jgi:hypothetical protein
MAHSIHVSYLLIFLNWDFAQEINCALYTDRSILFVKMRRISCCSFWVIFMMESSDSWWPKHHFNIILEHKNPHVFVITVPLDTVKVVCAWRYLQQYFSNTICGLSFIGGTNLSIRRKPLTCSNHWQTWSHKVVSTTPHHNLIAQGCIE